MISIEQEHQDLWQTRHQELEDPDAILVASEERQTLNGQISIDPKSNKHFAWVVYGHKEDMFKMPDVDC